MKGTPKFFLFLFIFLFLFLPYLVLRADAQEEVSYSSLFNLINKTEIERFTNDLAQLSSRVVGYPGYYKASEYIFNKLTKLNSTKVEKEFFEVYVPLDRGGKIIVHLSNHTTISMDAWALWPNLVQTCKTPPNGVSGKLIYLSDMSSTSDNLREINNSIILLEFNSGKRWIDAAALGAKAAIFIEPNSTNYAEARSKFLLTPIYFPRMYVNRSSGELLKHLANKNVTVTIFNSMEITKVEGINIVAKINGTEYPNDIIVVAAHFDSWSVVPAINPGADEATSVATLLELARFFSENPPKRSIWLVAFSGYYEGLAGERDFVLRHFYDKKVISGDQKIWMMITLDFSTDSNTVSFLREGMFYYYGSSMIMSKWSGWLDATVRKIIDALYAQLNWPVTNLPTDGLSSNWWGAVPTPFILDSEPFSIAHGLGFTIRTDRTLRFFWGTPVSKVNEVNFKNLWPQVYVSFALVYNFVNMPTSNWGLSWDQVKPAISGKSKTIIASGATDVAGFISVVGKVVEFNVTKGWYDPAPDAIVVIFPGAVGSSNYPFNLIVTKSDRLGLFKVEGLAYGLSPSVGWYTFLAFGFNKTSNLINLATDMGTYGTQFLPNSYSLTNDPSNVTVVTFRCNTVDIFGVYDTQSQGPLVLRDPRTSSPWKTSAMQPSLLNAKTLAPDLSFGMYSVPDDQVVMLFTQPNSRFIFYMKTINLFNFIIANTTNTEALPYNFRGDITSSENEFRILAPLYSSRDFLQFAESRYEVFRSAHVYNPIIDFYLNEASKYKGLISKVLMEGDISKLFALSTLQNNYGIRAYNAVMSLINDIPVVAVVFMSIVVFFSFFASALLTEKPYRLGLLFILFFSTTTSLFFILNPLLRLAANIIISPLVVMISIFFLVVLVLFSTETTTTLKRIRTKLLGTHFIERDITSLMIIIFPYSINQFKKHKLRTFLTLFSISSIVFAFVSLTSLTVYQSLVPVIIKQGRSTPYTGLLIKYAMTQQPTAFDPKIVTLLNGLKNKTLDFIVSIRVWWYPETVGSAGVQTYIKSNLNAYLVSSVLGLSPEDKFAFNWSSVLVNGSFFGTRDYYSAIIPLSASKSLNVSVGDSIIFEGMKLRIIGIFNETKATRSIVDLDQYSIAPIDTSVDGLTVGGSSKEPTYEPLSWSSVIIIPARLALDIGGYISSVSIITNNSKTAIQLAKFLSLSFSFPIYASDGKSIFSYNAIAAYSGEGFSIALPLIIIGAASISTATLGAVKERSKELYIYSSVGLPPSGAAFIFIIEGILISILSVIPAYLFGFIVNYILIGSKLLPSNFALNATSSSVIIAIIAGILATLVAMFYPMYIASRMITPSLERKWKVPTKPKGDEWIIPLPFSLAEESESKGALVYLAEYLSSHATETPDPFIVRNVKIDMKNGVILSEVSLVPLDVGVFQLVQIASKYNYDSARFEYILQVRRVSGDLESWSRMNYNFIDAIRKQLLTWRLLSESERNNYINKAKSFEEKR
ncbi:MAG: M28 family peptidase [Thermoproteota archaeon]